MTGHPLAAALRDRLVMRLVRAGHLTSGPWIDAVRDVPRHLLTTTMFQAAGQGKWAAVHPDDRDWLDRMHRDVELVTELDGDDDRWIEALHGAVTGTPTATTPPPSQLMRMLEALDVIAGDRVLVVGDSDGYPTALLAHRLGSTGVVNVAMDKSTRDRVDQGLRRCGYTPLVVRGASTARSIVGAPYGHVLATQPIFWIPTSWISQTRPAGHIVAALDRPLAGDLIVRLTVTGDGTATGRFVPTPAAAQPVTAATERLARLRERLERVPGGQKRPATLATGLHPDLQLLAALILRNVTSADDGIYRWLLDPGDSWACCDTRTGVVVQHGPRRLWDELDSAHDIWVRAGRPTREQIGLTVTATGEHQYHVDTGDPAKAPLAWPDPESR